MNNSVSVSKGFKIPFVSESCPWDKSCQYSLKAYLTKVIFIIFNREKFMDVLTTLV